MTAAAAQEEKYTVLCVDDNPHVADALRTKFARDGSYSWLGWLRDATGLVDAVREECPAIVLLDLDMPGRDPFEALAEMVTVCSETKVIVFSGHVRKELIDRATEAGAWGYVSKNEGDEVLFETIERVLREEFTLSPEVRAVLGN